MRILVHAGFHKTGTSSLQSCAAANADRLSRNLNLLLPGDLRPVAQLARRFTIRPEQRKLNRMRRELNAVLPPPDKPLFITSEDLSGLVPGRRPGAGYDEAPELLRTVVTTLDDRYPQAEITVWFTTRDEDAWMKSIYWQNLRGHRITEDFDTYRARLTDSLPLADRVEAVRAGLRGRARVLSTGVETSRARAVGPLSLALDLLGLPDEGLTPTPPGNLRPKDGIETLLKLNRSTLDEDRLARRKRRYLRKQRMGRL
ncbi:hypothetical protein PVW46_06910 [Mameliella sp. AT18]|nr:hypothetical protein [Mameliella sp. AT18]ODM47073.1 hypothetical protein A9320_24400 [Ruegeria sp. PBVC088]